MTQQKRESNYELAIHMLEEYNEIIGFKEGVDFNKIKEQLLAETDEEFNKTFVIILTLHDLVRRHMECREFIEGINTYEDNYIRNIYLGGLE